MSADPITVILSVFAVLMIGYWLLELHYFLRTLVCLLHAKIFKKKLHILDKATYSSICLTTDVDILLFHMNNARYLREIDFARTDFYNRTNLWNKIREKGGLVFQGGTNIRYRRFIRLFHLYYITSEIVYWDQNSIYMEHRFVTKKDNFVRAIVYCKQKVVKCNVEEVMSELLKEHHHGGNGNHNNNNATGGAAGNNNVVADGCCLENGLRTKKPDCPLEVRLWIESTLVSSTRLRPCDITTDSSVTIDK